MKKYAFTYNIKQVNVQDGYILVEYMPVDTSLTAYTYNLPTFTRKDDGTLKTIDEVINDFAPYHMWESQELLKSTMLLNTSGTIDPNN